MTDETEHLCIGRDSACPEPEPTLEPESAETGVEHVVAD